MSPRDASAAFDNLAAAQAAGRDPVWWLRDWLRRYDEGAAMEDPAEGIRDALALLELMRPLPWRLRLRWAVLHLVKP